MKYTLKYGKQENLTTSFFDYVILCRKKTQQRNGQTAASSPSPLKVTKNYSAIILTAVADKVYNVLLLNCIQPEIEKILQKNQTGFGGIDPQLHRF